MTLGSRYTPNVEDHSDPADQYRLERGISEESFQKIITKNADALLIVNQEGIIRFVNPAAEKMFGRSAVRLVGEHFGHPLLHGEKTELVILPKPYHKPIVAEMRVVEMMWQGEMCFLASLRDVTERKALTEALHLSEKKYRAYIDNSPIAIFVTNHQGHYLEVNPAACQLSGYSEAELLQMSVADLPAPEALGEGLAAFMRLLEKGHEYAEVLCQRKNGSQYYLAINAVVLDEERIIIFCQDITERRHTERLVRMQRDLAVVLSGSRDLFETLHRILVTVIEVDSVDAGGIYLVDEEDGSLRLQVYQGLSRSFVDQIMYYSPDSWQAKLAFQGTAVFTQVSELEDNNLLQAEGIQSLAILPVHHNHTVIALINLASRSGHQFSPFTRNLLEAVAAQTGGFIARAKAEETLRQRNSELQRLHEELRQQMQLLQETQARLLQSEKLAAIGELVAGLAHELNNPLASILLHAQLLMQGTLDAQTRQDLQEIARQAQRMSKIAHHLLQFSKPQISQVVPANLNRSVESALNFLAYELRSHNIQVVSQLAPDLPVVMIDEDQMLQVLVNLINNALYAMYTANGKGILTVITEWGSPIYLDGATRPSVAVRLLVRDNGPGIPPAVQPHIFDPFFTTKPVGDGVGLGLSLSYSIVREQNGQIWVESRPGEQTTFFIELPAKPQTEIGDLPAKGSLTSSFAEGRQNVRQTRRVLVVDDEPGIVRAITAVLSNVGYQVNGTSQAQTALVLLANNQYDLLISDLVMPDMSGIELCQEICNRFAHMRNRIIFITGDTISSTSRHFLCESGIPFLTKPFDAEELLQAVQRQLERLADEKTG